MATCSQGQGGQKPTWTWLPFGDPKCSRRLNQSKTASFLQSFYLCIVKYYIYYTLQRPEGHFQPFNKYWFYSQDRELEVNMIIKFCLSNHCSSTLSQFETLNSSAFFLSLFFVLNENLSYLFSNRNHFLYWNFSFWLLSRINCHILNYSNLLQASNAFAGFFDLSKTLIFDSTYFLSSVIMTICRIVNCQWGMPMNYSQ